MSTGGYSRDYCLGTTSSLVSLTHWGRDKMDAIFQRHFQMDFLVWISIRISLKFVPKGPINNIPALVQIMAWRRSGDKPLYEPMMVSLPTHLCVTRPQWVNGMKILLWKINMNKIQILWCDIIFYMNKCKTGSDDKKTGQIVQDLTLCLQT